MTAGLTHRGSREALLGKNPSAEAIAQYSNEQHVTAKTPPALLFHSDDDTVVPSMNSVVFYQALKKNKVPAVLYILIKAGMAGECGIISNTIISGLICWPIG